MATVYVHWSSLCKPEYVLIRTYSVGCETLPNMIRSRLCKLVFCKQKSCARRWSQIPRERHIWPDVNGAFEMSRHWKQAECRHVNTFWAHSAIFNLNSVILFIFIWFRLQERRWNQQEPDSVRQTVTGQQRAAVWTRTTAPPPNRTEYNQKKLSHRLNRMMNWEMFTSNLVYLSFEGNAIDFGKLPSFGNIVCLTSNMCSEWSESVWWRLSVSGRFSKWIMKVCFAFGGDRGTDHENEKFYLVLL